MDHQQFIYMVKCISVTLGIPYIEVLERVAACQNEMKTELKMSSEDRTEVLLSRLDERVKEEGIIWVA